MRLFLAVTPPSEVLEDLVDFLEPRREAGAELRWTDPEQVHLTLAFLPDVRRDVVPKLEEALTDRLARVPAFAVQLAGSGAFPNPYAARVLFAGVGMGSDELSALARATRHTAAHAGAEVDGGAFHPHLTVARVRRPIEATRWLRILQGYESSGWLVDSVSLIESRLGQGRERRPRYEPLAHFALAPPAGAARGADSR